MAVPFRAMPVGSEPAVAKVKRHSRVRKRKIVWVMRNASWMYERAQVNELGGIRLECLLVRGSKAAPSRGNNY